MFSLEPARTKAIVSLVFRGTGDSDVDICTGVVVTHTAVLTAKHCMDRDGDEMWDPSPSGEPLGTIALGKPDDTNAVRGSADAVWLHPDLDIALLEASWVGDAEVNVSPLVPGSEALDESWVGSPVELAGYGDTGFLEPAALFFAVEAVSRIETDHIVVDGRGRSGACYGDSGGPLLGRASDGSVRVFGVLDDGAPSCTGEDFYTRSDRLLDWEPFAQIVSFDRLNEGCDGLSRVGLCSRGLAMWCDEGHSRVDDCYAKELICGWNQDAAGFRCVAIDEDPCEGLGSVAQCDGDTLRTCANGSPASVTCQVCGDHCESWVSERGAACVSE